MAKTKAQKKKDVASLTAKMQEARAVVFVNYKGLKVKEIEELRKKLRASQIDYVVAKKTLTNIALEKAGLKEVDAKSLEGQIALVFGKEDEILLAKLLHQFAKEHPALSFLTAIIDKKAIKKEEIVALAQLPTKGELLAKMIGSISAPLSGLINVLMGNLRCLVYALKAIADSKN